MRLKVIAITIVCFLFLSMTACSNVSSGEQQSGNASETADESGDATNSEITEDSRSAMSATPIQPIQFSSFEELSDFISDHSEKISVYLDQAKAQYSDISRSYKTTGWIYSVTTADGGKSNGIIVYPKATYEDSGLGYPFVYKDKDIQVLIYKAEAISDMSRRQNMNTYIDDRFGFSGTRVEMNNADSIYPDSPLFWTGASVNSIWGFLDENYYMVLKSELPREDMEAFLSTVRLEKKVLDDTKQ